MKQLLTYMLISVLLMVLLSAGHAAENAGAAIWKNSKYEPTDVAMTLEQLSPHTYYVQGPPGTPVDNQGFMSNAGVILTDEGVVVFDSLGTPSLAYLLLSKIREVTDKPIKKVVMSHYHADHVFGLQVFKEAGAEVIAPAGAKAYIDSGIGQGRLKERRQSLFPWVDENTYVVSPDILVSEEYRFSLGGLDFVVMPLGSTHSEGDQMLSVEQDKVLFAGDLIFEGRVPFVAGAKPKHWMENIAALDASKYQVIVPGHGPASTHTASILSFTNEYLHFVYDNMSHAVDELMSFDEAYSAMDWSKYENLPAHQANRMNAYYIFLDLEAASMK